VEREARISIELIQQFIAHLGSHDSQSSQEEANQEPMP
jgi:hypothetical protein